MQTELIDQRLSELQAAGISSPIIEHIRQHIEEATAPGLQHLSPYRMADDWEMPRREVLEAFLYGTRLGIFDLKWNIRCPSCKGFAERADHLALLTPKSHCDFCRIDIQANFDDLVQITFDVNENIRPGDRVTWQELLAYWDMVEPRAELHVAPGETHEQTLDLEIGTYYVGYVPLTIEDPATTEENVVELTFDGKELRRADTERYPPGPITLRITNTGSKPLEATLWYLKPYPWTSAAELASTQSFRDLFSSELISADETFSIQNLVIVFTDIKGSTELYERLGDSDAYYLVKEHFKILTEKVREHNGAVVKTIGDAVMATFMVSTNAIEAVLDMQRAFDDFNTEHRDAIIIKVGAHRGPCIAVTSNERLDYFGRTVNIAARVQGLSTGEDIMLTRTLYDEPGIQTIIAADGWQPRFFQTTLRGLHSEHDVVHLTCDS